MWNSREIEKKLQPKTFTGGYFSLPHPPVLKILKILLTLVTHITHFSYPKVIILCLLVAPVFPKT